MITIPSPLRALMKTSVEINGLVVPGRQASVSLQRYCRPVWQVFVAGLVGGIGVHARLADRRGQPDNWQLCAAQCVTTSLM